MPHFQWNGYKVRYEVHGHGPVVVLVHGWAQSARCWDQFVPSLRSRYQVYCIDLPGFGGSDKPSRFSYALEDLASVLVDFIAHLKVPRVILMGHSMGGVVSLLTAILAPQRLQGLVLVNTPVQGPSRPLRMFRSVVFPEFWFELGRNVEVAVRIATLVTVGRWDVRGTWAMQDVGRASPSAASRTYMRLSRLDLRRAAKAVHVPTLVVGCEGDRVVPVQAAHLLSGCIPGAELAVLPHMQHMPMVEDPTRLASAVMPFLRRVQAEPGP